MSNRRLRKKNRNLEEESKKKDEKMKQQERIIRELQKKLENSIDQSLVTKMIRAGYEKEEGAGSLLEQIENEYNHRKEKKKNKEKIAKILNDTKDHVGRSNLKKSKPVFKNDDFLAYNNSYVQFLLNKKIEEIEAIQKREEEKKREIKLIYQRLYDVYEKINGKNYVGRINDIARIIGGDWSQWMCNTRFKETKGNIIDSPNAKQGGLLKNMANLIK